MRIRFFVVPVLDSEEAEAEVNRFLASHRVLSIDRELVPALSGHVWALAVTYQSSSRTSSPSRKGRIDYKLVLSDEDFAAYAGLRDLRKQLAREEGVPPYALFHNAQLAAMVTQRARTRTDLSAIEGVGPARVDAYGAAFLERLLELQSGQEPSELSNEADGDPID